MATGPSRRRRASSARPVTVVLVLLVLTCGCLGTGGGDTTSTTVVATDETPQSETLTRETASVTTGDKPPAGLSSRLFQLELAENRTAYAATHGLEVRDGRVLVVVTLAPNRSIPERFDVETELTRDDEVLGYVRIDDLTDLARSSAVLRIAPPQRASTNRITTSPQHIHPSHT